MTALLELRDFAVSLGPPARRLPIVEDVSLSLGSGRILCLVGESGSGKSVTAMALMRLLPEGGSAITAARAEFAGQNLLGLDEAAMQRLRGDRMAMIFQEPMTSLNPVFTIGAQIGETLSLHRGATRAQARAGALAALREVQIPMAERRLDSYPHELSGGMRQRAMIAMALVCEPALLIADEPTTALDVTIQSQILALLRGMRDRLGTAILLITHNLGVVAEIADEVAVMYAGRLVEICPADALFRDAQHPYTLALLAAMPSVSGVVARLEPIPGRMPPPGAMPEGCRFAPRCPFSVDICAQTPPLREIAPGHRVACWRAPVESLA
jgi:oligopeptide/dipeptide ABC transporter ATP-binding protein